MAMDEREERVQAAIEEAIVGGLKQASALALDVRTKAVLQVAIRDGIMAGLKAWDAEQIDAREVTGRESSAD